MDLDTLIIEADPARRVVDGGPDSAAGLRLYHDITRRRPRGRPVARPAAAFLAVAAVLAGMSVAVRAGWPGSGPGPGPARGSGAAIRAGHGMPPYYVTIGQGPDVVVRDSVTGKSLATVALPGGPGRRQVPVAAAGSDRRFVIETGSGAAARFYLLLVAPGGRSARLAGLPVPTLSVGEVVDDIAVSPDGHRLAVAVQCTRSRHGAIEVVSLRGGVARWWTATRAGIPWNLSWRDGSRELAFYWQDNSRSGGSASATQTGLWLLNTATGGSDPMSGERISLDVPAADTVQSAVLTPDGRTVIAAVSGNRGGLHAGSVTGGILELSARTGRPARTLLAEHAARTPGGSYYSFPCNMYAIDATGRHLLVDCNGFGRLDHGRFAALPGWPVTSAAW